MSVQHLADKLAITELLYRYAELIDAGELTVGQVAATIGVSRSSLYRALSTS